ncbi:hypothetical protein A9G37_01130 [Gilliamella sp. GillExp13]|nr:hypothetical protein A9G37_01130 [Gilliamella apicola]
MIQSKIRKLINLSKRFGSYLKKGQKSCILLIEKRVKYRKNLRLVFLPGLMQQKNLMVKTGFMLPILFLDILAEFGGFVCSF